MAINDNLPGVEVTIEIEEQPIPEYDDSSEKLDGPLADKTVVKYVESISDTCFRIRVNALPACSKEHSLRFLLFLDGKPFSRGQTIQCNNLPCDITVDGWESGTVGDGNRLLLPFKFSEVEILDDADQFLIKEASAIAKELGEIVVKAYRVNEAAKMSMEETLRELKTQAAGDSPFYTLPEKALKGRDITHGISHGGFGQSVAVEIIPHCKVIHVDPLDEPLAIYKLRYRSRAALKAALILDEFEVISPDELLRRAREVLRNERRNVVVKQEIKVERVIKRER